ncbi:MAG: hypothetical protein R2766_11835 [Saprospiraceae bacterium]
MSTYAKKENITRSFSLMRLAINLGFTIGPAVGGVVAQHYGFQVDIRLGGATCFVADIGIGFIFYLKSMH